MAKYVQKVIHLELDGKHYYFGSLRALSDTFGKDAIGLNYNSLRCMGISPETPFKNKKCIIREGILVTKPKKGGDEPKETGAK